MGILATFLLATIGALEVSQAYDACQVVRGHVSELRVTLHKSRTVCFSNPYSTAAIAAPEIANVLPMTDFMLYVQGKSIGTTNISVFDEEKHVMAVIDLEVTPDTGSLHKKIVATTGDTNINVSSANGEVVLTGEAGDAVAAARAVDMAKGLSKDLPVVNAMKVAPSQQVMLKVRFLEVNRNAGRDLGVSFFGGNKHGVGVSGLGNSTVNATNGQVSTSTTTGNVTINSGVVPPGNASSSSTFNSGANNGIGGAIIGGVSNSIVNGVFPGAASGALPFGALLAQVINTHGLQIDTLISALETKGLVKALAEPNLIAQSGESADFFAGGDIPIPTVQPGTTGTTPTVSVQYHRCGVTLKFVPTVMNSGLINLHLAPDVCEISSNAPVVVNGTVIPQLTERSAETTVELRDGQSFAIAGLLQAQTLEDISQLPWLGSLPVLGALFRSTSYQKQETDLVVIVTPHLVSPVPPGKHLVTPFDTTLQANDVDLFLMGDAERKKRYTEFVTSGGGLQGPYGHILSAR